MCTNLTSGENTIEENIRVLGPQYGVGMAVAARADSSKAMAGLG
ncbi:MAG TPA: hypothetical protein VMU34_04345 [Mycobacterium sp.]|nr:hypothetical protein [Mycobacterium sp.]